MGESILTRASGTAGTIVPVIPGYHVVLVTLKDSTGTPIPGMRVNCKDGTQYFDYLTNEKGKTMFSTNSGSINLYAPTVFPNNTIIIDHKPVYKNMIDCPVGLSSSIELKMQGYNDGENIVFSQSGTLKSSQPPYFVQNANYIFLSTSRVDLGVGGGGGGGGSGGYWDNDAYGGGSGGELRTQYGIGISKGYIYSGWLGDGGFGGWMPSMEVQYTGQSGDSSTFLGLSAIGGSGGGQVKAISPNSGWFGNGFHQYPSSDITMIHRNSNVNYGGGGGGSWSFLGSSSNPWNYYNAINSNPAARANCPFFGGYPYGGNGSGNRVVFSNGVEGIQPASDGIDGGGGGGGMTSKGHHMPEVHGGRGGNGRIELKLYR